jgi:hypothetical protein
MMRLYKLSLILLASSLLIPSPAPAALQALSSSDPGFLDSVLSFFYQDLSTSKRVLGFMKSRAIAARAMIDAPKISLTEKNRRIFIEVNRANQVLQDSRRQISEELYTTFKVRIDQARHRAAASDFWLKRKNNPTRALIHLTALRQELEDTLGTIGWIEWASGGF